MLKLVLYASINIFSAQEFEARLVQQDEQKKMRQTYKSRKDALLCLYIPFPVICTTSPYY